MKTKVNIFEAKTHLSAIIQSIVKTGKPVTLCKSGKPIVDLVPHRPARDPLKQSPELKGAHFISDPCAGVDLEDWPEEFR